MMEETQGYYYEKKSLKRGAWSAEEDQKLVAYIGRYGIWNWNEMPRFAGLSRSGKSCRLRWMNYLRPEINHGDFTHEEDENILKLHHELGSRWSKIASRMPGRTDNDIKNRWHSRLKKRLLDKNNQMQETQTANNIIIDAPGPSSNLEGCRVMMNTPTSPQLCTDDFSLSASDSSVTTTIEDSSNIFSEASQNFWELSFIDEGLFLMDGIGATTFADNPGFMGSSTSLSGGLEDDISPPFTSYGDELWSWFSDANSQGNEY